MLQLISRLLLNFLSVNHKFLMFYQAGLNNNNNSQNLSITAEDADQLDFNMANILNMSLCL